MDNIIQNIIFKGNPLLFDPIHGKKTFGCVFAKFICLIDQFNLELPTSTLVHFHNGNTVIEQHEYQETPFEVNLFIVTEGLSNVKENTV